MLSLESVAVTGPTGFIGRSLVHALVAMGCRPVLLSRSCKQFSPENVWGDQVRWIRVDLTDGSSVFDVLNRERPAILFHLAGTRGSASVAGSALACAELNIVATVRLLDAAHAAGARRIILMGSASEYGDQAGPLREGLTPQPLSPYGTSKAAATRFAQVMCRADGCPVVIIRPFTVYGPGQPADMFVADAITHALDGTPFRMTHGRQRRDFVFVDDVVQALIAAARTPGIEGHVINIGSGHASRLKEVAALIWRLSESNAALLIGERPARPDEDHDTWADIGLASQLLGWTPRIDLESGLQLTIQWTRKNLIKTAQPSSTR